MSRVDMAGLITVTKNCRIRGEPVELRGESCAYHIIDSNCTVVPACGVCRISILRKIG